MKFERMIFWSLLVKLEVEKLPVSLLVLKECYDDDFFFQGHNNFHNCWIDLLVIGA